jgi:AbrB family looped-hinge helix DNA binding protein
MAMRMKALKRNSYYISHITSKGQTTIPKAVRAMLGLKEGSEVAFKPTAGGFMMIRVTTTIKEDNPYTAAEWKAIESIASEKGKSFKSLSATLKHLHI